MSAAHRRLEVEDLKERLEEDRKRREDRSGYHPNYHKVSDRADKGEWNGGWDNLVRELEKDR